MLNFGKMTTVSYMAVLFMGMLLLPHSALADKEKEKEKEDDDKPRTSGKGDPLMMAFDGSLFFFHGEPGKIYDFASIAGGFQVAALLKEANNAVHLGLDRNGTYMEALGFKEEDNKVVVRTYADFSARIVVTVNGEDLDLTDARAGASIPLKAGGLLQVDIDRFQKGRVPPGIDHAGYWQPSYLNLDLTLNQRPKEALQGVIGNTYHYTATGMTASSLDTPEKNIPVPAYSDIVYPLLPDAAYEMPSLFAAPSMTFPAGFLHDLITTRKAALYRVMQSSPAATSA